MNVPDVFERFRTYHSKPENSAWGSLHIVLDDFNLSNADVDFCIGSAKDKGDNEGEALAVILRNMSKTQRGKIARTA